MSEWQVFLCEESPGMWETMHFKVKERKTDLIDK